ncbi:roadblock/LC7 domain-containing protein [Thermodesulfobacteriota bacterium]
MDYTVELNEKQIDSIEQILNQSLVDIGVDCVLLIDLAGNILISLDNGSSQFDVYSLAALAAGNFGAVSEIAKIIGENDFSLLFHKGENESVHFSKVSDDLLLIVIFGKDVSLGFVRLKVSEAVDGIDTLIAT